MNRTKVTPQIAVADQPTGADLEALRKEGYTGVLNLRNPGEPDQPLDPEAEGRKVRALGMDYLHSGIGSAPLHEDQVETICDFISRHGDEGMVLVHCRKGGRAAAMVVLHRALDERWDVAELARRGKDMGLNLEGGPLKLIQDYMDQHTLGI
jgi:uncharacterized protein (TIGR01244 family)